MWETLLGLFASEVGREPYTVPLELPTEERILEDKIRLSQQLSKESVDREADYAEANPMYYSDDITARLLFDLAPEFLDVPLPATNP